MNLAENFHQTNHLPSRTVWLDNQEYLFFSGTSYLGLPQNSDFQLLVGEGLRQYGSVYGSSRNGNLQLQIYAQAEQKLADWAGAPAALTLSSGMLAGQAVVRQLWQENTVFLYSPDAHPAVWHAPQVNIPAGTFEDWAAQVPQMLLEIKQNSGVMLPQIVLVTNSTDALRGKLHHFDWVADLPNVPLTLVVDDSHGLGVRGWSGRGVFGEIPKPPQVQIIVTASLAKAMGLAGGVIFAKPSFLQTIRGSAYFGGCSPMAPHQLWAYWHADPLYAQAQEQLVQNITLFSGLIKNLGLFSSSPNYPVFHTQRDDLYPFLLQNQVLIYSFSYPKATDKANNRIVLSAWHTANDIQHLAHLCQVFATNEYSPLID
ncbi:MAG: pyridoxal phosphate-dependent aminotransferase family protein [Runella slithyformis]|nr:MAG: pyridoxal phosphate-dependent aminotransferase family protein [Runella slithyformis]